jgi:hypothetical protein
MKGKQYSQQKRHAYKLDSYGRFGNLFIDGVQLMQYNKLVATDNNGNIVMIKKVDPSLIELLTKRYNKNKKYSESAKKDFQKLVKLANLPVHPSSSKYNLLKKEKSENLDTNEDDSSIRIVNDPNELVPMLDILIGEIAAGNDSNIVKNELSEVLDKLKIAKILSPTEHRTLFHQYISN